MISYWSVSNCNTILVSRIYINMIITTCHVTEGSPISPFQTRKQNLSPVFSKLHTFHSGIYSYTFHSIGWQTKWYLDHVKMHTYPIILIHLVSIKVRISFTERIVSFSMKISTRQFLSIRSLIQRISNIDFVLITLYLPL
jgi:hypothetical protein